MEIWEREERKVKRNRESSKGERDVDGERLLSIDLLHKTQIQFDLCSI